jgi:K+ transporter
MEKMNGENGAKCSCFYHDAIPVLMIIFALLFFLQAMGLIGEYFVSLAWPVLVAVAGVMKILGRRCNCCGDRKCCEGGKCC